MTAATRAATRPPAGLTRRDLARLRFARWRYARGHLHDGVRRCLVCNPTGLVAGLPRCPVCHGRGWREVG